MRHSRAVYEQGAIASATRNPTVLFETVFTRESSLPETVPQSRTDVAKIRHVQIACCDVRRILKSLKNDKSPGPDGIPPILLNELAEEIS